MGKDLDDFLGILALGALVLGIAGFFDKPKCPVCKTPLTNKPAFCPYCRTPLQWRG